MKKSTLITTIAMIVVVVVALSTATYAWFSTTQATYADINITIAADSNLTVILNGANIYEDGENYVTFSANDFTTDADEENGDGIRAGIWVPNQITALAQTPSHATSVDECGISADASEFAAGTFNKGEQKVDIEKSYVMSPTLIHVENNMAQSQDVTLKILIGYNNDNASKYAASGVAAYVANNAGLVAATDYYLPTTAAVEASESYTKDYFTMTASQTANSTKKFSDSAATDASHGNHKASIATTVAPSNAAQATADQLIAYEKLGDYAYFYVLSVSLGEFAQNASQNYLVYTWLDAGYLNDNAKGAGLGIVFAFTSTNHVQS